ncbi:mandelate racemase/muconate lactonizing enzyme family protein [Nocardioides sp.]|uniref:mandelate racemase/muconate lactonizing enzyme family protein n=1 Tax=Nocardioides sp. TaxID=35761 RepID=UPI00261BBE8C|nr:mandelate racemase/muconate lactonizing enzyme family protein [Nocardioides sp.]MDI6911719.1 mandelate racemase/muconate lactonizing enzyme family protein [Nocardioides sp.]
MTTHPASGANIDSHASSVVDAVTTLEGRQLPIREIRTIPVRVPLAREFKGSYYRMTHRATLIIQVITTEGIVGEAYVGDEDAAAAEINAVVHQEIAPRLIGLNALATERCWQVAYPATFDILRDRRIGLVALAAVDTAIWDAVGKALAQPLWLLWGGARDSVPMTAIGGYYGEPLGPIAEEVAYYRDELGLAGMKFKVGGRTPEIDAARIRQARDAAGDEFVLCIDANQGYSVEDAVDLAHRIADLGIEWFEEPVLWHNDVRSMRDVRYRGGLPVCAGQSELSPSGCRDLMEAGAIDVCNFDASWSGGPTAWRRTAAIAGSYDVRMGHHEEPQVSTHLLASIPHGTYAECFHPDRDPFWWRLIANRPALVDGRLPMQPNPGLGWELDWEYINAHRLDR